MLPTSFPPGTRFADVEGIPVSRTPDMVCRAWDTKEPRRFNAASFSHNGTLLTEAQFRVFVAKEVSMSKSGEKSQAQRNLQQTMALKGDYLTRPFTQEEMDRAMKQNEEEEACRASDHLIVWPQSD
jgi:hypothetical protein